MKSNFFNLPNYFIALNLLIFINYDLYPIPVLLLVLLLIFNEYEIHLTKIQKFIIKIQVFLFLVVLRIIPAIFNQYSSVWKKIFQQNYIIEGGIFEDLQILLFSLSCNKSGKTSIDTYIIKFTENDMVISCSFELPYGYIFNFLKFNSSYIWITTLIVSTFALSLFFKIYISLIKLNNEKDFILISAIFLSPPINFVTERMNFDLLIFLILYFLYSNPNINYFFKSLIISILSLLKFYPIIILILEFIINLFDKKIKSSLTYLIFINLNLYYFFYFESNLNSVNSFFRNTESHRTFGLVNDSLYISQIFQLDFLTSITILFCLILFFIYLIRNINFSKINTVDFYFLVMFLILSLFINYDYRLIFLVILLKTVVKVKNKYFTSVFSLFIFSSPTLLHSYSKYFKLIENDEFYYFDFSFYLFIAVVIKILIEFLIDSILPEDTLKKFNLLLRKLVNKFLKFLSKDL